MKIKKQMKNKIKNINIETLIFVKKTSFKRKENHKYKQSFYLFIEYIIVKRLINFKSKK